MEIRRKRDLIEKVAFRWRNAHCYEVGEEEVWKPPHAKQLFGQLAALAPPTEEAIAKILGGDHFISNKCDECENQAEVVIGFGRTDDDRANALNLCPRCVSDAIISISAWRDPEEKYVEVECEECGRGGFSFSFKRWNYSTGHLIICLSCLEDSRQAS